MVDKMPMQYYCDNPDDKEGFHYFLNHKWDYISGVGCPLTLYAEYVHKLQNPVSATGCRFVFITIQDWKRRHTDSEKLKTFIERIAYMYDAGFWIIESGKQPKLEDCNFHIHLLVQIKKSIKNHKKVLNAKWVGLFDTNLYNKDYYKMKQHRPSKDMPSYDDWYIEKLDYFDDAKKGLEHKNSFNMELSGTFKSL